MHGIHIQFWPTLVMCRYMMPLRSCRQEQRNKGTRQAGWEKTSRAALGKIDSFFCVGGKST